ncbi:Zn(II)2Cys6 transcription factor [Aspergillus undulatus]|uniref:Zn(II)2Cys6 transcription factor n=1 Tax=Aspergillus undulatus TaxID=1810928 RepID=UPI003CCD46C5
MSSTYYIGPFGRMLPVADGPAEQETDRPAANLSVPTSHPYQLPPPRTSAPLQFGTDPFLRPRNRGERNDEREESPGYMRGCGYQQPNEQLPSVSQLLTPTAQSSRSPSPYNPRSFGIYLPSNEHGEPHERLRYNEPSTHPLGSRYGVYEQPRATLDAMTLPQSQNLPPISHLSTHTHSHDNPGYPNLNPNSPHPPYPSVLHQRYNDESNARTPGSVPQLGTGNPEFFDAIGKSVKSQVRLHVVDERYIEGEGLCYIYADGSHCPKIIDGVPVNANWGITKAGKPRKRLAQACLTCREKKIKCHPNLPKCDQCQKSGRECRFESAPRGHRAVSKASQFTRKYDMRESSLPENPNNAGTSSSLYSVAKASESLTSLPGTNSQSPLSDDSMLTPSAVDSYRDNVTSPEQRYAARLQHNSGTHENIPRHSIGSASSNATNYAGLLTEIKDPDSHDSMANEWRADPYTTDSGSATHFIENYFTYVNDRLYYMFPRRRFLLWFKTSHTNSSHTKSLDDHMLLYSMMALGSVFSDRPDRMAAMKRYSRTARYALEHSQRSLTIQLAQTRIILSLWYYAIGALAKSWEAAGAAVRTVCGLRYNVEMGGVIVEQSQPCEYGLHPQALIECRRRTFWSAFLTDRLVCFYAPSTTFISSQTAFLRLPCREEIYEAQEYTTVPFFQTFLNQVPSHDSELSGLSAMALLVDVTSIWGDVSDHVFRLSLIPAESYNQLFEEFYGNMVRRSEQWLSRLPKHLTFTAVNLERSIQGRKVDAFILIHLLYHASLLKLNRYTRSQLLRPGKAKQYVHTARNHAAEILRTALALIRYVSDYNVSPLTTEPTPRATLLSPFLAYVILSAIDVLSAGGQIIDLPECINLIHGGLDVVRDLSCFWGSIRPLVTLIETRLDAMVAAHQLVTPDCGKVAFFLDGPSLDSQVQNGVQKQGSSVNEDLLYGGLPREQLFHAFGLVDLLYSVSNVLWIRVRG